VAAIGGPGRRIDIVRFAELGDLSGSEVKEAVGGGGGISLRVQPRAAEPHRVAVWGEAWTVFSGRLIFKQHFRLAAVHRYEGDLARLAAGRQNADCHAAAVR